MKIRYGFVTNSSSSSFIIGRGTEGTVEDVYQMLRELYLELQIKYEKAIEYVESLTKKEIIYSHERGLVIPNESKMTWEESSVIRDNFERCTELNYWNICGYKGLPEWVLRCETYEEYETYWKEKTEGQPYKEAPFTIGDFLNPDIVWLRGGGDPDTIDTSYDNETLNWYIGCAEDFPGCTKDFSECPMRKRYEEHHLWGFDLDESLCKRIQAAADKKNICYEVLGRFCIYSECGYIPQWIVERLSEKSEFSCNHMG